MIPLVGNLTIVEHYKDVFESVFSPEEFEQFKRYTSGLIINGNKTVESINRLFFLDVQNQCTLNRFLTHSDFKASELNTVRLKWLQECEQTAFKDADGSKGVLIIDDTLLAHDGHQFEKCAKLYDHVSGTHIWAHNLVNLHYSDDQIDYPVDYRFWEPPDLEAVEQALVKIGFTLNEDKLGIKTTKPLCWRTYLLQAYHRKRLYPYKKVEKGCIVFANQLVEQHRQAIKDKLSPIFEKVGIHYKGKKEIYYAYCHTHTLQNLGKQRFVISFSKDDFSDEPKFYVSNRLHWRAGGILRIRRHRWPIEVYHEEGKEEGLDKYQVRQFDAIIKHIACVCVTYSLLKRAQFDQTFLNKLQWKPNNKVFSLPLFRRVMIANALIEFLDWFSRSMINGMDKKTLVSQIAKVYA